MKKCFILFAALGLSQLSHAQIFAQWLFDRGNDNNPASGTISPNIGSGTLSAAGGTNTVFASGIPNGTSDNSSLYTANYPAQGKASGTAGIEVAVNTTGKSNISVYWWQLNAASASRYTQFQYSIDGGSSWKIADLTKISITGTTSLIDPADNAFLANTYEVWYYRVLDLSSLAEVNNNAGFRFRIVTVFSPFSLNGSYYESTAGQGGTYLPAGRTLFDEVTVREGSALPVKLGNFTGSVIGTIPQLNWQTYNETNFSHFSIERSANAVDYAEVGKVISAGKSSGDAYIFKDISKTSGINYYRLRIVDKDGSFSYSPTVLLNVKNTSTSFALYPNPVQNSFVLNHAKALPGASLQVVTPDGKRLAKYAVTTGSTQTSGSVSGFKTGVYYAVFVNGNNQKQTIKFLKK